MCLKRAFYWWDFCCWKFPVFDPFRDKSTKQKVVFKSLNLCNCTLFPLVNNTILIILTIEFKLAEWKSAGHEREGMWRQKSDTSHQLLNLKRVSYCPVGGEGDCWGRGERVAEPHPITCSFLAGKEAEKSAFSLSFINLTTCAKSPGIRVNQTDTDTLAAVLWVTWEAHPGACCF